MRIQYGSPFLTGKKSFGLTHCFPRTAVSGTRGGPKAKGPVSVTGPWAKGFGKPSKYGGCTRIRTLDPLIKSQLLYQLSYAPIFTGVSAVQHRCCGAGYKGPEAS